MTHSILLCTGEFCFKDSPYYSQENLVSSQLSEHTTCEYTNSLCDVREHEFFHSYNLSFVIYWSKIDVLL